MDAVPSDNVSERLVWLDMEMTGLDPEVCVPIEVAVIITTGKLEELPDAHYEAVIHQPATAFVGMAPIVVEMHTQNGLLDRVRAASTSIEQADQALATLIRSYCEPGKALLSGNTIQQDRRFIRRYMPKTEACLHYRILDVSSVKEIVRRWYGSNAIFAKQTSHTAMADIRNSIEELRYYREKYFRESPC